MSKLHGKATDWYFLLAHHMTLSVNELLEKMDNMFDQPLRKRERRQLAQARSWKDESFNDYCHDKLILGNKVPVDEDELIDFVIEGIPSSTNVKNQARMHCFSTMAYLYQAFRLIKFDKMEPPTNKRDHTNTRSVTAKYSAEKVTSPRRDCRSKRKMTLGGEARCFGCNQTGHYLNDCP